MEKSTGTRLVTYINLALYLANDIWMDSVAATGSGNSAHIEEAIELISTAIEIMERPHLKNRPAHKDDGSSMDLRATFGSEAQRYRQMRTQWLTLRQHPHPESCFDSHQMLAAKLQVKSQRHRLVWFEPGTVVRIEGLKNANAAYLNGTEATVKSFDYGKKCFAVLSEAAAKEIAILPECLALVRAPPKCATRTSQPEAKVTPVDLHRQLGEATNLYMQCTTLPVRA